MGKFGIKQLSILAGLFALIVSFQNCAEQKFSTTGVSGGSSVTFGNSDDDAYGVVTQTNGPNCRSVLRNSTAPIKMIFTVDVSGSNRSGQSGTPATDPQKAVRGDSIRRFYNSYATKTNFAWSFITFAGTQAKSLLKLGNSQAMSSTIDDFFNITDNGNTPYLPALNETSAIINGDTSRTADTKYVVVFFSDGMPNPTVAVQTLTQNVTNIINLVPGRVSFNTVYYGQYNADAAGRLQAMAQAGGGNFLDTNANPTGNAFLISDLVVVPGEVCQ